MRIVTRGDQQFREHELLSPDAAFSDESDGRDRSSDPDFLRNDFQRDRDKILHTKSFRRLSHKTQVFLAAEGDHFRTRLTHTLEVSQIARTIARALGLNEDLAEAISLGHDLGHTPFGHAGESALDKLCPEGFRHYMQSLRVVDKLEKDGRGLNLTWEVRNGIVTHTKGTWARKPFELIDWQEQIIRDIFGVLKPNGYRQFNTAYIEIPKKQGKSELAAAVALLLTCGDGEERAEVYGCAADRQQASIVFNVAADMVRMCPALSKRVKILDSQKRLIYQPTGSIYQVLSADVGNKHGFNTHGVVFDELHTQPNRKLFDVMTKGSGDARMQPLYFLITTAGNDTKSICYEIHQKAKDIIEGRKIDHTFYPVIYGAEESDDWTDPKVWKKANPSLGITVGIDKVKDACESAKQNPGEENSFRQLRLNQWVKQAVRWMPMEKWDRCAFAVSEDDLEGRVCYGGLDLSSTTDITAFVLVFPPEDENDKYVILPYFWIPEDNLDLRVRRDHVPYDVWERQGFLQTTEGNVVHYGYIEKFIESLGERFNIREIAFDRWGAVQMVQNLEGMGFTIVPFGQGFKDMSPPTKELMKLVLEQRIAHGGHPVLRWMMDNIFIRTDPAGNIKPDKEKSTEKIDGAVATIMALDRAIRCGNDNGASVYDNRGILFI